MKAYFNPDTLSVLFTEKVPEEPDLDGYCEVRLNRKAYRADWVFVVASYILQEFDQDMEIPLPAKLVMPWVSTCVSILRDYPNTNIDTLWRSFIGRYLNSGGVYNICGSPEETLSTLVELGCRVEESSTVRDINSILLQESLNATLSAKDIPRHIVRPSKYLLLPISKELLEREPHRAHKLPFDPLGTWITERGDSVVKTVLLPRTPSSIFNAFLVGRDRHTSTPFYLGLPPHYVTRSLAACLRWTMNARVGDAVIEI